MRGAACSTSHAPSAAWNNDADRLRKYLLKFGLKWDAVAGRTP